MRKASEKTLRTCLVNMFCVGKFGKCLTPFTMKERGVIIDEMINRGWIDANCHVTTCGVEACKGNLDLCQY